MQHTLSKSKNVIGPSKSPKSISWEDKNERINMEECVRTESKCCISNKTIYPVNLRERNSVGSQGRKHMKFGRLGRSS